VATPDPRAGIPAPWPASLLARIRRRGRSRTIVVLDDDPTGTQTVRGVPVLIEPTADQLQALLVAGTPLAFILTNSRSLPETRAARLAARLGGAIRRASLATARPVSLVSRSDSTLRGHFPAEVDALARAAGIPEAPILLMPFLAEAGRITVGDVHYVVRDDTPIPVAETEYARDPAFAYRESDLRRWVAARLPAGDDRPITSLPLERIRTGGPDAVAAALRDLPPRAVCVANAADGRDAEVVVAAMVEVEAERPIVARTAAGYVRARAGQAAVPDLAPAALAVGAGAGLVVVGSHVPMTTRQLERLLADPPLPVEVVELPAGAALDPATARRARAKAAARTTALIEAGVTPVLATTRERLEPPPDDPTGLVLAGRISRMLVGAVSGLERRPAWILAKGGITSSDVATIGLGARSATVLGQLLPGVPVWRVAPPGWRRPILFVVFPGNVGDADALRVAVAKLAEAGFSRSRGRT
jgi:uncharacterized protein YgbK (DUF1537 family)